MSKAILSIHIVSVGRETQNHSRCHAETDYYQLTLLYWQVVLLMDVFEFTEESPSEEDEESVVSSVKVGASSQPGTNTKAGYRGGISKARAAPTPPVKRQRKSAPPAPQATNNNTPLFPR